MSQATTANELLGHPKGLYVCFLTEMWERFAFYGMKALLLLYLTKYHLFPDADGYVLLGTYAGLAYALPLIGGMLADRYLGMRKAVVFGGLLLVLGQLGMAYTGHAASGSVDNATRDNTAVQVMYLALALIAVGVGFLKPNISTIVGRLYSENDPRRDAGFTIFYMGINVGAMLSSIICGFIGEKYGWSWGFGIAGVLMLFGLAQFLLGQNHLHGHAEPPDTEKLRARRFGPLSTEWMIYLSALVAVVVLQQVLQIKLSFAFLTALAGGHEVTLTEVVATAMGLGLLVWFVWFVSKITPAERGRMIVLMVLIVISAVFWALYEQTYGSWVAFTDRTMNPDLFPQFVRRDGSTTMPWSTMSLVLIPGGVLLAMRIQGTAQKLLLGLTLAGSLLFLLHDILIVPQNAGSLTFLGALFVVLLTPLFAWLWPVLDRLKLNPSASAKFGWGLIFAGLSFGVLVLAARSVGADGLVSVWWLVLAYLVLEIGEMALSPVGLSAVTTLSVPRVVGLMMGAWFLASAFGEMLAGRLGTLAAMDPTTERSQALLTFGNSFLVLMFVGLASGVLMLLLTPMMKRLTQSS
ncbi:MFS transporter [Ahniella affigens]|uniref:MFS transporter n=1 Tax=Ahniella affigens TaxID=2021234 RepID=A0A2P1PUC3_9GAMM|nr:peptide MFS transporter [Ahniella affigens]AVP98443.1 MFS transporter [Ahniella affigens]